MNEGRRALARRLQVLGAAITLALCALAGVDHLAAGRDRLGLVMLGAAAVGTVVFAVVRRRRARAG